MRSTASPDLADRARAWYRAAHAAVCDVSEPWEHGTVVRATRFPDYFDFNMVRVEGDPAMSAAALALFADEALAGLPHRRIDFEQAEVGEPLRPGFAALGWMTERLAWMHHETAPPAGPDVVVKEVPYEAVHDLRVAWHFEDFPGHDPRNYFAEAREVAALRGARVLAVHEAGAPIAFAELLRDGESAEVSQVYVLPEHRGRGLGTATTRAAMEAAGEARDLWIVADDAGRPKELYARLGFRPIWAVVMTLRLPG